MQANEVAGMKVWIDQDLCTGDGICEEICPSVFGMADDGLAYVKQPEWADVYGDPRQDEPPLKMADGLAPVPPEDVEAAIEAADECPGECIFIEMT
ncbi:MAG: ferredoxin [Acidimicrobiales bacterium]|nr:ferredoxin [Acidimicrobiales bacterium]